MPLAKRLVYKGMIASEIHYSELDGVRHTHPYMGPEDLSNRKKCPSFFLKPNFRKLQADYKNVSLKIVVLDFHFRHWKGPNREQVKGNFSM